MARVLAVTALVGAGVIVSAASGTAQTDAQEYGFSGEEETFVVPADVCLVRITAIGGDGGSTTATGGPVTDGGLGGETRATIAVTPGETLTVRVGSAGGDALDDDAGIGGNSGPSFSGGDGSDGLDAGGGGGAASSVSRGGDPIVGAGGGGGAGGLGEDGAGGEGGDGGGGTGANGVPGTGSVVDNGGVGGGAGTTEGTDGEVPDNAGGGNGGGGGGGGSGVVAAGASDVDLSGTNGEGEGFVAIEWTVGLGCPIVVEPTFTG
jgi:hypothetical protein